MCQIRLANDPPLVKAGSATQGLAGPLGQGAGETRYLLGPQTKALFVVVVNGGIDRLVSRSVADRAMDPGRHDPLCGAARRPRYALEMENHAVAKASSAFAHRRRSTAGMLSAR